VSNLPAHEVQTIYNICVREGYVRPSVYQGGFNPIAHGAEERLAPTLRKLGIAFYAFSSLGGGGYFSRPVAELRHPRVRGWTR
jgi:aflatoxin B1 aldehyde reductase